jgi:hypothetical protein
MFIHRIVFCLYHDCPRGRCSCLHQHFGHLFSELHDTSMGHARLVCTQFSILHTSWKVGSYRFLFPSNGSLWMIPLFLSLTTTFSVEETLMDFGYTYAPNLIHHGAFVITEISSAHGYKNSTSSNSDEVIHGPELILKHSKKGKKLYKVVKN